jgi:tetratricopeptide (TPR) repeat protein
VRKDVRVVNLSLLNTPWYIHQLKDQLGVPIKISDEQIDSLMPMRVQGYDRIWRVQDEMVKQIITNSQANNWNPPVYFAMTVADENKLGLNDHLILEGMVLRVVESTGKDRVNTAVGHKIFTDRAHFRSIGDPEVFKDENDYRLISNYISAIFQVVEAYERGGRPDSALIMAEAGVNLRPPHSLWQAYAYLVKMYAYYGKFDKIPAVIEGMDEKTGEKVYLTVAQDILMAGNYKPASELLKIALERFPSSFPALNNLVMACYQQGDPISAEAAIQTFRSKNAGDATLMFQVDDMMARIAEESRALSEFK